MSFCVICFLCSFHRSRQISSEQQLPFSDFTTELEDSRRFSLNSLMTLLAVLAISGSKVLQPVVVIVIIYVISLHLAITACFLQNYPILSRFLHVVPILSTLCMAGAELVFDAPSPALAAIGLLLGGLPLLTLVIHHGRQCAETSVEGSSSVGTQGIPHVAPGSVATVA